MKKIEEIAMLVMELTEDDFKEAESIITDQKNYINPLKMGTVNWQHALGEHNERIVAKIKELKAEIESGKDIRPENYGSDFKIDY